MDRTEPVHERGSRQTVLKAFFLGDNFFAKLNAQSLSIETDLCGQEEKGKNIRIKYKFCLLYTSPSPRDS